MLRFKFLIYSIVVLVGVVAGLYIVYDTVMQDRQIVAEDLSCACGGVSSDSLERPLKYIRGPFKGQCVNSCTHRFPTLLSVDEPLNTVKVANIFHQEKFWTATIPTSQIQSVDIIFETFAPGINHVSMAFNLSKKNQVFLKTQSLDESSVETTVDSFVLSPEAALPTGKAYSLKDGLFGYYVLMNRLISTDQYLAMIQKLNHPVRFYRTKLNALESQRLFQIALKDSKDILNNPYQLFFNNCATSVIDYNLKAQQKLVSMEWDFWDVVDPLRGIPSSTTLGTLRTLSWWDIIDYSTTNESN